MVFFSGALFQLLGKCGGLPTAAKMKKEFSKVSEL